MPNYVLSISHVLTHLINPMRKVTIIIPILQVKKLSNQAAYSQIQSHIVDSKHSELNPFWSWDPPSTHQKPFSNLGSEEQVTCFLNSYIF